MEVGMGVEGVGGWMDWPSDLQSEREGVGSQIV
jgi:hypothetical protein